MFINKLSKIFNTNTVVRNFSVLSICSIGVQMLSVLSNIRLARIFGPTQFGTFSLITINVSILAIIASIGLRNIIIRSIARNPELSKMYFITSLLLRIIGLLITSIAFYFYNQTNETFDAVIVLFIIINTLSVSGWELIENIAFGKQKMSYSGIINLATTFVWVCLIYILPRNMFTIHHIFGISVFIQLVKTVVFYIYCERNHFFSGKHNVKTIPNFSVSLLKDSSHFYILALLTMLTVQIPNIFLQYRSDSDQLAFFNLAQKLLNPMTLVINTALAAIFPNLSKLFVSNRELFMNRVKKAFILFLVFGLTGAYIVTFFRNEVTLLLYGESYQHTALVLAYQCWYYVLFSIFCLIGTILGAIDRQRELSILSVFYALISTPILWFASKGGAENLSIAFLISAALNMTYHWYYLQKYMPVKLTNRFSFIFFLVIILAFVLSLLISEKLIFIYKLSLFSILAGAVYIFLKFKKIKIQL